MIKFFSGFLMFSLIFLTHEMKETLASGESFYELKAVDIDGNPIAFKKYKGKVLLIVNVASRCGFTDQYKGLVALKSKYESKGFDILGFPSNQFLKQEPGTNQEIKSFCQSRFGLNFQLFEKGDVNGKNRQPVYQYLLSEQNKVDRDDIGWNFTKFLIDRKGQIIARFSPKTTPEGSEITQQIEKALTEK